jgi:hypothetical protein
VPSLGGPSFSVLVMVKVYWPQNESNCLKSAEQLVFYWTEATFGSGVQATGTARF